MPSIALTVCGEKDSPRSFDISRIDYVSLRKNKTDDGRYEDGATVVMRTVPGKEAERFPVRQTVDEIGKLVTDEKAVLKVMDMVKELPADAKRVAEDWKPPATEDAAPAAPAAPANPAKP